MSNKVSSNEEKQLLKALSNMKETVILEEDKRDKKLYATVEYPISLEDTLSKKTKAELDTIRKFYGLQGLSALKKAQLIEVLIESIVNQMESFLESIDAERMQVINKILQNGGYYAFTDLTHQKISYFRESGIVATGSINGERVLYIPADLVEQLKALCESTDIKQAVKQNTELLKITKGIIFYYGAVSYNELQSMIEKLLKKPVNLLMYLELLLDRRVYDSEIIFKDGYVQHDELEDLDKLKKEHKMRPHIGFYPFTKEQLFKASEPGYIDQTASYQQLVQYMVTHYPMKKSEAENIVGEIVFLIKIGKQFGEILLYLQEYIDFQDADEVNAFMNPVMTLVNHTKQWHLKGYAPKEIRKPNTNPTAVLATPDSSNIIDIKSRQKKVGRNELCPCGSGKKYKKCCGK
ncbi:SEC-C metal-binding domain-containing protein [Cytobacillus gottheilii]|uniref:SEC-C domain-containing protein n=2 Tax=Cytobacillus gottheilii TaxID=859144 RepID=A0ABX8FHD5_9BACI|nr:SEC-C metal-binding domain-containing protein [Cytobacillus gottheilii]QVY63436.1 SEC-C domain-containing protein [Cytobacillus gottheilii]